MPNIDLRGYELKAMCELVLQARAVSRMVEKSDRETAARLASYAHIVEDIADRAEGIEQQPVALGGTVRSIPT